MLNRKLWKWEPIFHERWKGWGKVINQELLDWLTYNKVSYEIKHHKIKDARFDKPRHHISFNFERESDALLFKLTWL